MNKIQFEKVDGSYPDNKELRDVLFAVSGQRGKYPQCFLKEESGSYRFVGLWDEVESLIECNTIPADVLASNPQIKTFNQVFKTFIILFIVYFAVVLYFRCLLMRQEYEAECFLHPSVNF